MKTLTNILGYTFIGIVVFVLGGSLLVSITSADGINYQQDTLQQQELLDSTVLSLEQAKLNEDIAYQAYLDARSNTANIKQMVCAQTLILAQLKYRDTPAEMEDERIRLHDSANKARECEMTVF